MSMSCIVMEGLCHRNSVLGFTHNWLFLFNVDRFIECQFFSVNVSFSNNIDLYQTRDLKFCLFSCSLLFRYFTTVFVLFFCLRNLLQSLPTLEVFGIA